MDKSLEQQLLELKAEAWDTSIFLQLQQRDFEKFIAPHNAKLNKLIGEINKLSVQRKQTEKGVQSDGQKIIVTSNDNSSETAKKSEES